MLYYNLYILGERDQQTQWISAVRRIYRERKKAKIEAKRLSDLALAKELENAANRRNLETVPVNAEVIAVVGDDVDEDGFYEGIQDDNEDDDEDDFFSVQEAIPVVGDEQHRENVIQVPGTVVLPVQQPVAIRLPSKSPPRAPSKRAGKVPRKRPAKVVTKLKWVPVQELVTKRLPTKSPPNLPTISPPKVLTKSPSKVPTKSPPKVPTRRLA
jgi:hypothetical protein